MREGVWTSRPCGEGVLTVWGLPWRALPGALLRPRSRRGAFTFVEVLATLTLVAIVFPTVMSGISISLQAGDFATHQAQAPSLAQSKMAELVAQGQWQQATLSGDFSPDYPDYRWNAQVSEWDGVSLEQLDVTVSWRQRGRERSVVLSTLVNTGAAE